MAHNRQTRSGSQTFTFSLEDINQLILRSEERVISQLENKIMLLENRIESIQAEQVRLAQENDKLKTIITDQQRQIEGSEAKRRELNLIVSGISEKGIEIDGSKLVDDMQKLNYIFSIANADFDPSCLLSHSRLGSVKTNQSRLIKVTFDSLTSRNMVFHQQKLIRADTKCRIAFGPIYLNRDSTFLIRKEEKRLRDTMQNLKHSNPSNENIFIRNGKLYKDSVLVDKIDIANQLF